MTDGTADWDNVTQITFYAEGYFGRTLEEPLILIDGEIEIFNNTEMNIQYGQDTAFDAVAYEVPNQIRFIKILENF